MVSVKEDKNIIQGWSALDSLSELSDRKGVLSGEKWWASSQEIIRWAIERQYGKLHVNYPQVNDIKITWRMQTTNEETMSGSS